MPSNAASFFNRMSIALMSATAASDIDWERSTDQ